MVRKLPWARASTSTISTTQNKPPARVHSPATPPKRKRRDVSEETNSTGVSPLKSFRDASCVASSLTGSAPAATPPPQDPMRPSDDVWIMVEDELYAIAQTYTQDLHQAEYQRLKLLAAKRGNDVNTRPIDQRAVLSKEAKRWKKQELKRKRVNGPMTASKLLAIKDAGSDNEIEEDLIIVDRNLAGLMMGTGGGRFAERTLLKGEAQTSNTRAAAGFEKQTTLVSEPTQVERLYDKPGAMKDKPQEQETRHVPAAIEEETEDEDDLDMPVRKTHKTPPPAAKVLPFIKSTFNNTTSRAKPSSGLGQSMLTGTQTLTAKPASYHVSAPRPAPIPLEANTSGFLFDDFPQTRVVPSSFGSPRRVGKGDASVKAVECSMFGDSCRPRGLAAGKDFRVGRADKKIKLEEEIPMFL